MASRGQPLFYCFLMRPYSLLAYSCGFQLAVERGAESFGALLSTQARHVGWAARQKESELQRAWFEKQRLVEARPASHCPLPQSFLHTKPIRRCGTN